MEFCDMMENKFRSYYGNIQKLSRNNGSFVIGSSYIPGHMKEHIVYEHKKDIDILNFYVFQNSGEENIKELTNIIKCNELTTKYRNKELDVKIFFLDRDLNNRFHLDNETEIINKILFYLFV